MSVVYRFFGPFLRVFSIGDSFVGFHEDTIPSVVMQVCNNLEEEQKEEEEKEEDDKVRAK